jgi:hypothetical protein
VWTTIASSQRQREEEILLSGKCSPVPERTVILFSAYLAAVPERTVILFSGYLAAVPQS